MDRTFLATVVAAVVLLVAGVGAGVFFTNTGAFDERPRVDAAVTGFSTGNVSCLPTGSADRTASVDTGNTSRGTFLVLRANLTLDDAPVPSNATVERVGLANYTLAYEPGERSPPDCPEGETPVVVTQTFFELPHLGEEPFGVTVTYRGEALFRLVNGPEALRVLDLGES